MSTTARRIQAFDDRLNPVMVKELRQAASSRFLAMLLIAFVVAELVTIAPYLRTDGSSQLTGFAGQQAFMWMMSIVAMAVLLFVPIQAGARLRTERAENRIELVRVSPLGAGSVLWGKIGSAWLVSAMILSAALPFLALTYLLRGIDLPTIFAVALFDWLASGLAIIYAVSLGAYGLGTVGRTVSTAFATAGLVVATLIVLVFNAAMINNLYAALGSVAFWAGLGVLLLLTLPVLMTLFVVAAERIDPPRLPRSRARPVPVRPRDTRSEPPSDAGPDPDPDPDADAASGPASETGAGRGAAPEPATADRTLAGESTE